MVTSLKEQPLKVRPVYRNIHVAQLTSYRLPPAGWVSILHRISGALMFLLLPFAIWLFDAEPRPPRCRSSSSGLSSPPAPGACRGGCGSCLAFALIWGYPDAFLRGRAPPLDGRDRTRSAWNSAASRAASAIGISTVLTLVPRRQAVRPVLTAWRPTAPSGSSSARTYGLRDWLSQRFTALIMAIFTVALLVQLVFGGPLDYYKWAAIFARHG
jgi:succinate dehydrogenase / fumarate reductase cytochrome b subunit